MDQKRRSVSVNRTDFAEIERIQRRAEYAKSKEEMR